MKFVGRTLELQQLREFGSGSASAIAVLYGRRRVGKSLLIEEFLQDANPLIFEALEERPKRDQINHFMFQVRRQLGSAVPERKPPATWKEALLVLFDAIEEHPRPIVFDEFQWMANYRRELVSELKYVWDRFFAKLAGQKLILCGSIASFMIEKVMKSSALYGRIDLEMHVSEFNLKETSEILPDKGPAEILEAHMLTSGVPKYLQLIGEQPSVHLAIEKIAFTPNKYWVNEYNRIFVSHFGKNPDFENIVRTLAEHPLGLTRKELAHAAKTVAGGPLTRRLRDLESAGFIRVTPPFDKPPESPQARYFLSDAYLRFYFSFILPNLDKIRSREESLFLKIMQSGAWHAWMGRAFEYTCIQHKKLIARILGFSQISYSAGPYFAAGKKGLSQGVQADLVFDRADNVLTLCEMKYSNAPVGVEIIPEMERKVAMLADVAGKKTIHRVLIVKDAPTRDLVNRGYFYRVIESTELFADEEGRVQAA